MPREPQLFNAYLFWITGGFMGLHRLYLKSWLGLVYLPEGRGVFPTLSVADNLKLAVRTLPKPERDAAVIAYQNGAGLADMLVPTNGAVLAMLLGAGVGYGRWMRFAVPGCLLVMIVGAIGVLLSV